MKPRSGTARWVAVVCAAALAAGTPGRGWAEPAPAAAEARERFDRALRLFDEGQHAAALAEFEQIQRISPNPIVVYNIGLVYAAMGRPAEAAAALASVLADPAALGAEREARARSVLEEQNRRIATVDIEVNVPGARIELDGVEIARAPLAAPLRVASGAHVLGAVAEDFAPQRREILVSGGSRTTVRFDLVPTRSVRPANVQIDTAVLGAEVVVDGAVVATTPLTSSLALPPGKHRIELRRPGYRAGAQTLELDEGGTATLSFPVEIDAAALAVHGVDLVLDISEPHATLVVDGVAHGPSTSPLRLPVGPHQLRVERAGFLPWERSVELAAGAATVLEVRLEPTAETRRRHAERIRTHRTRGWIGISAGAAAMGAGAIWLGVNARAKSKARADVSAIEHELATDTGRCDVDGGGASAEECNAAIQSLSDHRAAVEGRDVYGWVGVGAGAALVATGVAFLVTAPAPHDPEGPPSGMRVRVAPWTARGLVGATLSGRF